MQVNRPNENIGLWYQELSKDTGMGGQVHIPSDINLWPKSWTQVDYKEYENSEKVKLKDLDELNLLNINFQSIKDLLFSRQSKRDFLDKNHFITLDELSYFCKFGFGEFKKGETEALSRLHPSGGGRYSLEYYLFINRSKDLKRGLYHYNVKNNELELLDEYTTKKFPIVFGYDWAEHASCYVFMTSIFDRNMRKYGERGYRHILQESGHVGQNIYLLAANLNLNVTSIAGTKDLLIEKLLGVDGKSESLIYSMLIG